MRQPAAKAFVLITVLMLLACSPRHGEAKPDTQPVQGKVAFKDGRAFSDGGQIEFLHAEKEGVSARGEIRKDGTFELQTMTAQQKVKGAVEGNYSVKIIVSGADQNVKIFDLTKKYAVTKGDNNLTVVIDE